MKCNKCIKYRKKYVAWNIMHMFNLHLIRHLIRFKKIIVRYSKSQICILFLTYIQINFYIFINQLL